MAEPYHLQKTASGDVEKGSLEAHTQVVHDTIDLDGNRPLQRQMKPRHIQMISIGGVIGTGLFLGTANALRNGGPVGLLLGYMTMGSICFCVMQALGEMVAHIPIAGGHITLANRFVSPSLSFTMGWNYTYNWIIVLPAELSAAAVLIGYWTDINSAAWIALCLAVCVAINMGGARVYGECEYWFAIIKVLTIVGLIILGIVITAGGGPDHKAIGFRYWKSTPFVQYMDIPGAKGRFLGWFAVLIQAAFSYIGTEIVAICAGESRNPKKSIPKAIRNVYIRIILFYFLGTFVIGLLVDPTSPRLNLYHGTAAASPFVIAIQASGIKALPSIINACLLTSAWSAASSDLYTSSRALYGLAVNGQAPRIFSKVNSWGLPYMAVAISVAFGFLSFMAGQTGTAGQVFGYFANMTSVCGLLTWWGILWTYLRFYKGTKVQGIDRKSFAHRSPLQPYLSWYALILISAVLFFQAWNTLKPFDTANFVTSYLPVLLFPVLWIGHRVITGSKSNVIKYEAMDFVSGSMPELEIGEEEAPPKNIFEKIWRMLS